MCRIETTKLFTIYLRQNDSKQSNFVVVISEIGCNNESCLVISCGINLTIVPCLIIIVLFFLISYSLSLLSLKMEFPDLGGHCFVKSCNRLDFLPMKCDACSNIFCKDHFNYALHDCHNSYQRDVQVPVCPLCNKPVPSKRGEQPDIAVGEHIDRDCQSDPAISNRKIYTNKCNVKGCKQKEVIRINCDTCLKSYCLKHRHPTDHKCQEQKPVAPNHAAGAAAMARAAQNRNKFKFPWQSNQSCASNVERRPVSTSLPEVSITSVQGRFSEDEALALALQNSMKETKPRNVQEEEDRLLAQALANSEMERVGTSRSQGNREKNCSVS